MKNNNHDNGRLEKTKKKRFCLQKKGKQKLKRKKEESGIFVAECAFYENKNSSRRLNPDAITFNSA